MPIRNGDKITHMLMVSFDIEVDHEPLILKKIIDGKASFVSASGLKKLPAHI